MNPYAAVPSMHVAFALMLAGSMARIARRGWARALWVAYPALVAFVVVATANHWWIDAALGAATAALSAAAAQALLARARPHAWAWQPAPRRAGACAPTRIAADVDATGRDAHPRPRERRNGLRGRPPEADRVAADAERDLAHGLRPVRRRRRAGLAGAPVLGRLRLRGRLGLRHARRALLAHVGQGHASSARSWTRRWTGSRRASCSPRSPCCSPRTATTSRWPPS